MFLLFPYTLLQLTCQLHMAGIALNLIIPWKFLGSLQRPREDTFFLHLSSSSLASSPGFHHFSLHEMLKIPCLHLNFRDKVAGVWVLVLYFFQCLQFKLSLFPTSRQQMRTRMMTWCSTGKKATNRWTQMTESLCLSSSFRNFTQPQSWLFTAAQVSPFCVRNKKRVQ